MIRRRRGHQPSRRCERPLHRQITLSCGIPSNQACLPYCSRSFVAGSPSVPRGPSRHRLHGLFRHPCCLVRVICLQFPLTDESLNREGLLKQCGMRAKVNIREGIDGPSELRTLVGVEDVGLAVAFGNPSFGGAQANSEAHRGRRRGSPYCRSVREQGDYGSG